MKGRTILACIAVATAIIATGTATAFAANKSGFRTGQPSMLDPARPGVQVTPLMTVGDRLSSGFRFESIPDGISLRTRGKGRVDLFVNHETGKVPFPFVRANPNETNGENDFDNAQVSRLKLNQHSAGILGGSFAIDSSSGYQRFCSNYLATSKEGFDREILFTNEETPDYVFRQEDSWPPPIGDPNEHEAGARRGARRQVSAGTTPSTAWAGTTTRTASRSPGYGKPVVLSGDDTFTSGPLTGVPDTPLVPSQSQLYSYIAPNTNDLLADKGDLWAFVSDTPGVTSYYDVIPGSGMSVTGHFIKVPRDIATGLNPDGSEIKAADKGYPPPPNNGTWQTDLRSIAPVGIDGPHGCSSTGATSTMCSSSCGSRTSHTTSDPARAMSSTSPTPGGDEPRPRAWTRRTSGPRTAGSGRWCSTRATRRRSRHSPCSSKVTTHPSRPPPRSTNPTTSSRRATAFS